MLWMSNIIGLSVSDSDSFSNNDILFWFKEGIFILAKQLGKYRQEGKRKKLVTLFTLYYGDVCLTFIFKCFPIKTCSHEYPCKEYVYCLLE